MGKEERVIKDRLQKLIERMKELNYEGFKIKRLEKMVNELQQNSVYGVDKFVLKLLNSVNDKEAYSDIRMQGRFAVVLARNNFSNIQIEYTEKGPDLKADYNRRTVYFEVTRRHSEVDEWAEESEDTLPPPDKPEDVISRIQGKMGQLQSGEINIVVFWSSTVAVLNPDMEEAFECIQQEINQNPGVYKDLSGVLFTEGGGVDITTMKQFRLFKNNKASKPLGLRLTRKLESLHEQNPKKLQSDWEAVTLKRMEIKGKQ